MAYYRLRNTDGKAAKSSRQRFEGTGSPEGVVTASRGDTFYRTDGSTSTTFYVKETGDSTNTGWVAHGAGGGGSEYTELSQTFTATDSQTEFTVTSFSFTALSILKIIINGIRKEETTDWTRDVGNGKFNLIKGAFLNDQVVIEKHGSA